MSTHLTSGALTRGAQNVADCHPQAPALKCAVESCSDSVPADGADCCRIHAAEDEVVELADFVRAQVESIDGDIGEAIRAAHMLLGRLALLSAHRNVLALTATNGDNAS